MEIKKPEEIAEKYGIDLKKLEAEQKKLAKTLVLKDSIDFSKINRIAGIEGVFVKNKLISAVVVIDENFEIIEQKYFSDRARFPYIPGFRAYRELPVMISAVSGLEEKPDLVFIKGHGILHRRCLGLASHFSLATGIPSIGVANSLGVGELKGENITLNKKIVGKVINIKEGANPIYVSPGNLISVSSAEKIARRFTKEQHKTPEPLRLARKYAREVMREIV